MTSDHRRIGSAEIGPDRPVYVIAELGINHNGDLGTALQLVDAAVAAGADAVKFQKRSPELCVPPAQRDVERETPWGRMTYLDYRYRIEFGRTEYDAIDLHCRELGIAWFASPWDPPSVEFLELYDPPCHKIASASITDLETVDAVAKTGRTVILSTGMSTWDEIDTAVGRLDREALILLHTTSTYPAPAHEVNLRVMDAVAGRYGVPVGYSGHEIGLQISIAAAARGARVLERHLTLDRAMWGSDQAASMEPDGLRRLVRDVRVVTEALGDGIKRVNPGEVAPRARLRRVP
jgi:N-acetylneuraminate synthase